jgi:hypothetical protein
MVYMKKINVYQLLLLSGMYPEKSAKTQASRLFPGCREQGYMQDMTTVKESIKKLSENNNSKAQVKALECIKNWDEVVKLPQVSEETPVDLVDRFVASKKYPEMVSIINDNKLSDQDKILSLKDIIAEVEEESLAKLEAGRKEKAAVAAAKAKAKEEEEEEEEPAPKPTKIVRKK